LPIDKDTADIGGFNAPGIQILVNISARLDARLLSCQDGLRETCNPGRY